MKIKAKRNNRNSRKTAPLTVWEVYGNLMQIARIPQTSAHEDVAATYLLHDRWLDLNPEPDPYDDGFHVSVCDRHGNDTRVVSFRRRLPAVRFIDLLILLKELKSRGQVRD